MARYPFRTIASENYKTRKGTGGSFFRLEFNMVVFSFKPLGNEVAKRLQEALKRWIHVHESFTGRKFYGKGLIYQESVEVDEVVDKWERDSPYWHVTVREETNRNGDVDVQRLVSYNLRPRRRKGKTHLQQVSEFLDKLSSVPSPKLER